jgi:hypothetical protein
MTTLNSIPLNDIDRMHREAFGMNYSQYENNGVVQNVVNKGGLKDGTMTVTTRGLDDYLTFNVFLVKIRRESAGLSETHPVRRAAWTQMSQAFIDKFGEKNTPPDIVACLGDLRTLFGV